MSVRDDLERVGAEAVLDFLLPVFEGDRAIAAASYSELASAVLDAVLAYRDPDGNRMVILASELRHVGTLGVDADGEDEFMSTTEPIMLTSPVRLPGGEWIYESWGVPVFVLRPPSGEPT